MEGKRNSDENMVVFLSENRILPIQTSAGPGRLRIKTGICCIPGGVCGDPENLSGKGKPISYLVQCLPRIAQQQEL